MKKRIESFKYAFEGLRTLWRDEPNARIHLAIGLLTIAAGTYFDLETLEWVAIVFSIGIVFTAETLNSAIENVCDGLTRENNPFVKKAKDLGAAAVLLSAATAIVIGLLILGPKVLELFS